MKSKLKIDSNLEVSDDEDFGELFTHPKSGRNAPRNQRALRTKRMAQLRNTPMDMDDSSSNKFQFTQAFNQLEPRERW